MTRELLFTSSFESQLATTTGWNNLDTSVGTSPTHALAPSDFPGFVILPGEAMYTAYDSGGHPTAGLQHFTLRVLVNHPQLALSAARTTRSDYVGLIEAFFSGGYTPPAITTGDPVRIDSIILEKIDPATLNKNDTRSVIAAHGAYHFTLL